MPKSNKGLFLIHATKSHGLRDWRGEKHVPCLSALGQRLIEPPHMAAGHHGREREVLTNCTSRYSFVPDMAYRASQDSSTKASPRHKPCTQILR